MRFSVELPPENAMKFPVFTLSASFALLCAACTQPLAPDPASHRPQFVQRSLVVFASADPDIRPAPEGDCSFSRGTTTCVSTIQYEETSTRQVFSGCVVGPSFPPVGGRRIRTFSDVYLVTVERTTYYRGQSEHSYGSEDREVSRVLTSSTLVSDTCEAI